MSSVVEMHYTTTELSCLLRRSPRWVTDKIKAGEFGDGVYLVDGDYLVRASAVNSFLGSRVFSYDRGVRARNGAELRRRLESKRPDEQCAAA